MELSAPIHTGIKGDRTAAMTVRNIPAAGTAAAVWAETELIFSLSPLPTAFEIMARTATDMAEGTLFISHVTVVVTLTAAAAFSPSRPTMAVSTYWSRVDRSCSATVGTDRVRRVLRTVILSELFSRDILSLRWFMVFVT